MKKIMSFRILAIMLIAVIGIVSCSKDETESDLSKNAKISNYLNSFYKSGFVLGKSVESKRTSNYSAFSKTVELETVIITEVFVGDDSRARGYIITDKENSDFLYFVDVDRVEFKLTSVDIAANEQKLFENINDLDKYLSTDEFDFIEVAEEIKNNPDYMTDRRFWGWQEWIDCDRTTGMGIKMETYYVFGIGVKTRQVVGMDGGAVIEPCAGGALLDD